MPPDVSTREKLQNWNLPHEKNGARKRLAPHAPIGWRAPSKGFAAMQGSYFTFLIAPSRKGCPPGRIERNPPAKLKSRG
jgi:hypothetical protein